MGNETKRESYEKTKPKMPTQRQRVYEALCEKPMTRNELERHFAGTIRLSAICGRVNELLGQKLVIEEGTRFDIFTKRNVFVLYPSNNNQLELNFG